jgi:tRNA(Ile2) C34 agmatinyltransferase TiaS
MNVSNQTYACLACRKSARVSQWRKLPICPQCGKPMSCLGQHWRLPKRSDDKAWKILCANVERAIREGRSSNYYL